MSETRYNSLSDALNDSFISNANTYKELSLTDPPSPLTSLPPSLFTTPSPVKTERLSSPNVKVEATAPTVPSRSLGSRRAASSAGSSSARSAPLSHKEALFSSLKKKLSLLPYLCSYNGSGDDPFTRIPLCVRAISCSQASS